MGRAGGTTVEAAGHVVPITNPDKVFFPDIGATKLDLVRYYQRVGQALLAVARGHPAMLQRFPDGAGGKSFFQKRVPKGAPPWLRTVEVATPNGTTSNALVVADLAHVLWAVNLGCVGLHLWPCHVDDPDHVTELRIDLDPPEGSGFDLVREAAGAVRALLDELGVAGFPKSTGSRGLHVYVPLEPRWDAVDVRAGTVALARELERRHPRLITASWWKEERGRRVFVDFNQNAPHKTVFGPWSVRAAAGAPVSAPLSWDEIATVAPEDLTMTNVPERLERLGDPWADLPDRPQTMAPLLELAERDRAAGLLDAPWPPQYPKAPDEPPRVAPSRARREPTGSG